MRYFRTTLALAILASLPALAQPWATTGTTHLNVSVAAEAAIQIVTTDTLLTTSGGIFNDYTGTTLFNYKIRTGNASTSGGQITLQVTSDFTCSISPCTGPLAANNNLTFSPTISVPGTAGAAGAVAPTGTTAPVATFGSKAKSAVGGNNGSIAWRLVNLPTYDVADYQATVTFTISAT
jgi:hypothetical protein